MNDIPFSLADLEAMTEEEIEALDSSAFAGVTEEIAKRLTRADLLDFLEALDLLIDNKKYAAADAYSDGDLTASEIHHRTVRDAIVLTDRLKPIAGQ